MRAWYCLTCQLGWTEWGKWPRRCPYRGCKSIVPSEEAR